MSVHYYTLEEALVELSRAAMWLETDGKGFRIYQFGMENEPELLHEATTWEEAIGQAFNLRIIDRNNLSALRDECNKLRQALSFARSVIKSGEEWTYLCETIINGALDG